MSELQNHHILTVYFNNGDKTVMQPDEWVQFEISDGWLIVTKPGNHHVWLSPNHVNYFSVRPKDDENA